MEPQGTASNIHGTYLGIHDPKRTEICYKVVRVVDGQRVSLCANTDLLRLEYSKEVFARPPQWLLDRGYGIMAYSHLFLALLAMQDAAYAEESADFEVWRAVGMGPMPLPVRCLPILCLEEVRNQYSFEKAVSKTRPRLDWPRGTVVYSQLRLLNRVSTHYPIPV